MNVTNQAASILRENTGTSGLLESARAAVSTLAEHGIPHLIVGGLAVQEYGYPRVTIDVDIVVPDVLKAGGISHREFVWTILQAARN